MARGDRKKKREFLQLAHKLLPGNEFSLGEFEQIITGWLISDKVDGQLCYSDGGITKGMPTTKVPWANTLKDKRPFVSTGLWTRGGKSVQAPEWWTDALPNRMLAGELFLGPGRFNEVESIVRTHEPDDRWVDVTYEVFDQVSIEALCQPGRIKYRGCPDLWVVESEWLNFIHKRMKDHPLTDTEPVTFEKFYNTFTPEGEVVRKVEHHWLPIGTIKAEAEVDRHFLAALAKGEEGVMLRNPAGIWEPYRSHDLLKRKKYADEEGTVIGYVSGKLGVEDKHRGRMGSLWVENDFGKQFKVSGFTDKERAFATSSDFDWAHQNPGERTPEDIVNPTFPIGTRVTYTYMEKTPDGKARHANFLRERRCD